MHKKIKNLSLKRIKYFLENKVEFYKWHKTYLDWLKNELIEAQEEIKDNNSVYLEDELWDVFWDYICLLHCLQNEWKISSVEKVLERCYKKYIERIWKDWIWNWIWEDIKKIQKEELRIEHNNLYKNDKKNKL